MREEEFEYVDSIFASSGIYIDEWFTFYYDNKVIKKLLKSPFFKKIE